MLRSSILENDCFVIDSFKTTMLSFPGIISSFNSFFIAPHKECKLPEIYQGTKKVINRNR